MRSGISFIPFHTPSIGKAEIGEVIRTLRSGWLTTGGRTTRFEEEFRNFCGSRHALAVSSGTAALHLALATMDLRPGDEVITSPFTFCATVNVILQTGATPVLADVGRDGNIDPDSIAERITPRTRGIMPVHFAGLPCAMDRIRQLALTRGLFVIEDAAHALGTQYRGLPLGSSSSPYASEATAFSFYATKNITTGEGGMVVTNDHAMDDRMRILALHGINRDAWNRYGAGGNWYYEVLESGFKYNMCDILSAIGIHQLRRAEEFASTRRRYAALYSERFADLPEVEVPPDAGDGRHSWHLYVIRLNLDQLAVNRNTFIEELARKGIGVSVHFIPIPMHPFFARWAGLPSNHCPRALALYKRVISLPLYPGLSEANVDYIASVVKDIVARSRKSACALAWPA